MTTSYPTAVDTFVNPVATDPLNSGTVPHTGQHDNLNDSVKAIEVELGVLPKGASATVVARLNANDSAVALKAPLASPTFTGVAVIPAVIGNITITPSGSGVIPVVVKAVASQFADLQQWTDSTGVPLVVVNAAGIFRTVYITDLVGTGSYVTTTPGNAISIYSRSATNIALKVIATAGQSVDLQQWQDASNNVLASIGANGIIATGGIAGAPTIASAATIAPVKQISFVSGVTSIATITPPAPISIIGGQITIIPTGLFSTTTGGNIALATTAVVNKAIIFTYDPITTKWYPIS